MSSLLVLQEPMILTTYGYETKLSGEAIEIFKIAKKLNLTKRSYAWIVAQSVVGPNENERAPSEFHPGLLGKEQLSSVEYNCDVSERFTRQN